MELDYILTIRLLEGILEKKKIRIDYLLYAYNKGWLEKDKQTLSNLGANILFLNRKKLAMNTLTFFEAVEEQTFENVSDEVFMLLDYFIDAEFIKWELREEWKDCITTENGIDRMLDVLYQEAITIVNAEELEDVAGVNRYDKNFASKVKNALHSFLIHEINQNNNKESVLFYIVTSLGLSILKMTKEGYKHKENTCNFLRSFLEKTLTLSQKPSL